MPSDTIKESLENQIKLGLALACQSDLHERGTIKQTGEVSLVLESGVISQQTEEARPQPGLCKRGGGGFTAASVLVALFRKQVNLGLYETRLASLFAHPFVSLIPFHLSNSPQVTVKIKNRES